jgi:hypothetical protein
MIVEGIHLRRPLLATLREIELEAQSPPTPPFESPRPVKKAIVVPILVTLDDRDMHVQLWNEKWGNDKTQDHLLPSNPEMVPSASDSNSFPTTTDWFVDRLRLIQDRLVRENDGGDVEMAFTRLSCNLDHPLSTLDQIHSLVLRRISEYP